MPLRVGVGLAALLLFGAWAGSAVPLERAAGLAPAPAPEVAAQPLARSAGRARAKAPAPLAPAPLAPASPAEETSASSTDSRGQLPPRGAAGERQDFVAPFEEDAPPEDFARK